MFSYYNIIIPQVLLQKVWVVVLFVKFTFCTPKEFFEPEGNSNECKILNDLLLQSLNYSAYLAVTYMNIYVYINRL